MTTAVAVRAGAVTEQPVTTSTRDQAAVDEILMLIERSYDAFNELYEAGDFERYPWLQANLSKLESMADRYSPEKLHGWLSSLYKRYRSAKRGEAAQSTH